MDRKLPQPGFGWAVVMGLIFIGLQLGFSMPLGVVDAVYEQVLHRAPPGLSRHPAMLGIVNVLAAGGTIAFGLFLNRMRLRRAIPSPRITFAQVLAVMLIAFGGEVVMSEVGNLARWAVPPPRALRDLLSEVLSHGSVASQIFLLVIVAPVTEEIMFRGIILRGLLSRHRPAIAILLSALLFGVVHIDPWQALPVVFLGIAFGWIYLRSGSVPLTMICHASVNALALMGARSVVDIPGFSGDPLEEGLQLQPWWADVGGAFLLLGGILLFSKVTPAFRDEPPPAPPVIPFTSSHDVPVEAPPKIERQTSEPGSSVL